ncbi:MAG: hypothetical protein ABSH50_22990 [Bryobacteraceae bacterium]|jgi:hypothetical protein
MILYVCGPPFSGDGFHRHAGDELPAGDHAHGDSREIQIGDLATNPSREQAFRALDVGGVRERA